MQLGALLKPRVSHSNQMHTYFTTLLASLYNEPQSNHLTEISL